MNFGIIAAGNGSRLASEGAEKEKPMALLQGEPLIGRLIRIAFEGGADSVSVVINEKMPEAVAYLENLKQQYPGKLRVKGLSTPSSLHTLAALVEVMGAEAPAIVTTVDTVFREDEFRGYVEAFSRDRGNGAFMGVTGYIDDEKPLYVALDDDNIRGFLDSPQEGVEHVSAGIYGLHPQALALAQKCVDRGISRMRNFQREILLAGLPAKAYVFSKVIDVDHLSDLEKANNFITQN